MNPINHRDLELQICAPHLCGPDCCHIQVAGHFVYNNKKVVVSGCGCDEFTLADAWRKMDLSQSSRIESRHVVVGGDSALNFVYEKYTDIFSCVTPALIDLTAPRVARIMFAGAECIYIEGRYQNIKLTNSPEFCRAKKEGRVVILCD